MAGVALPVQWWVGNETKAMFEQTAFGILSFRRVLQWDWTAKNHDMSDAVRSIGLFHLAEERRRLQKHTEMKKPDQAAMSMYKRSWDDIHAAARSMHALMRSTSISSGWAARSCSIMLNACNTVAGIKARLAARSNGLASLGQSFHAAMAIFKGSRPHSTRAASWSFVTSLGVEGTWDCEKAPCTDLRSDPTLQQNSYRTTQADAYVNHAHQTSAARVVTNLIKLKHCRVKKTVSPSTPTYWRQAPSFRSRRNTISHRETKHNKQTTKTKHKKETGREGVPSVGLSYVKLCDTAALVH